MLRGFSYKTTGHNWWEPLLFNDIFYKNNAFITLLFLLCMVNKPDYKYMAGHRKPIETADNFLAILVRTIKIQL